MAKKGKKPASQKEILESQVQKLREQLLAVSGNLNDLRADKEWIRKRFEEEIESKELCLAHLRRVFKEEQTRCSDADADLSTKRAQAELRERREQEDSLTVERNHQMTKSSLQQLKSELKGKLSLFCEKRFERNNNLERVQNAKAALSNKMAIAQRAIRDEDTARVDQVLNFTEGLLYSFKESEEGWRLHLRMLLSGQVHRQKQVKAELKHDCRSIGWAVSKAFHRNRLLREYRKRFGLELELEILTQKYMRENKSGQDNLCGLLSVTQHHGIGEGQNQYRGKELSGFKRIQRKSNAIPPVEWAEMSHFALKDLKREVIGVLEDQEECSRSVKQQIGKQRNRNGIVMSAILRTGVIILNRCKKISCLHDQNMDSEVIAQIRMIMNLSSS